jgi:hypothetical protein
MTDINYEIQFYRNKTGKVYKAKNGNENKNLYFFQRNNGDHEWYKGTKLHRDGNLPAIVTINGDKYWYVNGKLHRLSSLPAIERANGIKHWYIYGIKYTYEQVCNYYKTLTIFGRYCLKKIRMRRLRRLRWIHGELLCMPPKGSYPGGQDYHKMVSYFMSM